MRAFLADFAFTRAERNQQAADRAAFGPRRARLLARSRWWSAVEAWLSGLGTWRALRRRSP